MGVERVAEGGCGWRQKIFSRLCICNVFHVCVAHGLEFFIFICFICICFIHYNCSLDLHILFADFCLSRQNFEQSASKTENSDLLFLFRTRNDDCLPMLTDFTIMTPFLMSKKA